MSHTATAAASKDAAQYSLLKALAQDLKNADLPASDATKTLLSKLDAAGSQTKNRGSKQCKETGKKSKAEVSAILELPTDWENVFSGDSRAEGVHAASIADGLILSLSNLGRVDIEYISAVTGENLKTVISTLKGAIYQNPETWEECFYKGWETAEEYLSGNMVQKWKTAKSANRKYSGYFSENLKAIQKVLPPAISTEDIYITLGSPWVPEEVIDDFIRHMFKANNLFHYATHDTYTGSWEIEFKSIYADRVASISTYGTPRMDAMHILERTLNMKPICVTDEISCPTTKSGKKRVVNVAETTAALEKQKKMIAEFQKWVWTEPNRKAELELIFENNFSSIRKRHFDGSFLTFPNMSPNVQLYPYQKNAVARILFSPNTLLAHDVGSGKTFVMIAAGMELRRMGLSKKNLYVVPNNLVSQWRSVFHTLYPDANVLCVTPRNFTPANRMHVLESIRDNDYDGIIMAYSCFDRVGLSQEHYVKELEETNARVKALLKKRGRTTGKLRTKAKNVDKALCKAITDLLKTESSVFFDELGITRLFVDEAHNYKNVPIDTQIDKVRGINTVGSKKCQDMMDKVHLIQKQNDGGGVVMATGTPITNSITDAYIMQKYLQDGELTMLDLQSFDSWVGMFAERVTEFEIDVDTSNYRMVTRFSKFHNLPELTTLLASIADFHQVNLTDGIPQMDGYTDAVIGKTREFDAYLKQISRRADDVRKHRVPRTEDNMLKITTDGRKAALDLRLVEPKSHFTYQSKVARCAENVWDIYHKTRAQKSTQLIFCDSSVPKKDFNMYDELRSLLFSMGIPAEEIAFIHDADSELRRKRLYAQVQSGDIRVLIGSTFKLGLGVNVQDKLIAVHHLDVPWRPADMTQREGRILRQGNENKNVFVYRYITEGSFDAYSWQLLETKQRFITGLLSGSLEDRNGSDIDDTTLNYAEVKALAVGNPLIKERVETANELTRLMNLQRKATENRVALEKELTELPDRMARQQEVIRKCREDAEFAAQNMTEQTKEQRQQLRRVIFDAVCANELATAETELLTYQGFRIVLPTNMRREKPYVWLERAGRYYVELGESEVGCLIRLDNMLEGLPAHLEKMEQNLESLIQREVSLKEELNKDEDFTERIAACKEKLNALDKELGADKNE